MNKILLYIVLALCLVSCSKPMQNVDEYYVKYVLKFCKNSVHSDKATISLTYTDVHLVSRVRTYTGTSGEDEFICGPFKRGDKITAYYKIESSILYSSSLEVYVSKNNLPFALRGEGRVEYIIDY